MKICAITMVYRDYWALSQWYMHYGRQIGESNLFVVAHGDDPEIQIICPEASVITVPRDDLSGFDQVRGNMLNSLQNALGFAYDWVIRTDADELVCFNPSAYSSFTDLLSQQDAPALFALGLEVFEQPGDANLAKDVPALNKRSTAVFSGHYSKAWAVRNSVELQRHGIRARTKQTDSLEFVMVPECFLVHLKYANKADMAGTNAVRTAVAESRAKKLPGTGWLLADKQTSKKFRHVAGLSEMDWEKALNVAFQRMQQSLRKDSLGVIRCKSVRFDFKTILPDWFKT